MSNKSNAVVILSGGLDSTILTYKVHPDYNLYALSFNYGQKQQIELQKAAITTQKLKIPHKIANLQMLGDLVRNVTSNIIGSDIEVPDVKTILGNPQPVTYIPNRNMIMLSIAAAYAEAVKATKIFIGVQIHDLYGYWDTQPQFIKAMNNVFSLNRNAEPVQIEAPFALLSKHDELLIAKDLNVPLEDTWTCYDPKDWHIPSQVQSPDNWRPNLACGKCGSCAERLKAFELAKMTDPLEYYPNG